MTNSNYREAKRVHTSVLAAAEKRLLIWMAERLPGWVNSDHLTVLAGLAMAVAGICYWIGPASPLAMAVAILMLGLNWFGDSLDGTLARVRHHERPRYGFYVDHVLDVIGILFLLAGFALGGFMTPVVAGWIPGRLLPADGRDRAGDTRRRNLPDFVLEVRSDGAADPADRRNAADRPLALRLDRR